MMEQVKKLVLQAFEEVDGCMGYCRSASESSKDPEMLEAYVHMASSKLDNASTLMSLAGRQVASKEGNGQADARDALDVLSEVIDERIRSARAILSTVKK